VRRRSIDRRAHRPFRPALRNHIRDMQIRLDGRARVLGDDVNTDYIITSARKRETIDAAILKRYLLETLDPGFAASIQPGDILVAGRNFGCGSAMEVAVTVPCAAGIRAILALSFARTYYRNAINNGLIPVECDTSTIREGDRLIVELGPELIVKNETGANVIPARALPVHMLRILEAGGLVPYLREHGRFEVTP
jgi:3-isopropylmalate/(R)-2-methylmalate dehydratase small subunit